MSKRNIPNNRAKNPRRAGLTVPRRRRRITVAGTTRQTASTTRPDHTPPTDSAIPAAPEQGPEKPPRPSPSPRNSSAESTGSTTVAESPLPTEPCDEIARHPWRPGRKSLIATLTILLLAAAATTGYLAWRPSPPDVAPAVAKSGNYKPGSIPSEPGQAAVHATVDALPALLSYDYRSLDKDLAQAKTRMTPAFLKTYNNAFRKAVKSQAHKNKAVTRTLVRGAGLINSTGHTARSLAYVDQILVSSNGKNQKKNKPAQISQNRVVVKLTNQHGRWLIAGLNPF